ncbi:MAG: hypothetical protein GEU80_07005 [Dehalococcoidia bacterium]|nr:hypothetical protein [Dehalococcoidia bacterium]
MTQDPASALREQAREWGRDLLGAAPWQQLAPHLSLLLTSPPAGIDLPAAPAGIDAWLLLDASEARLLSAPQREPLLRDGVTVERPSGASRIGLTVMTSEAAGRLVAGTTRRSLEARWLVRHAEPLHDRLRRGEQMAAVARQLPSDAPERITRALWLQTVQAVHALGAVAASPPAVVLPAAGEASAALCRLSCVVEDGTHPPLEWLLPAARETRVGRRVASWLDDLGASFGGDEAATRRVAAAREQVLREVETVLGEHWGDRPWVRAPEAAALRAAR